VPRSARIVIPDIPHHITQRGNNRQAVFLTDRDHLDYLAILKKQCKRYDLTVHGYCLMTNHVHLVATPGRENSLARALGRAHHLYSQRFNRHHGRSGHLWQSRFYSCPLDDEHLIHALVYVDRNPVRARLVPNPSDWPWSSARAHIGKDDPPGLLDLNAWRAFSKGIDWDKLILDEQDSTVVDRLRRHTHCGRPLGSERFVELIEKALGYPVRLEKRGRPKVNRKKERE
jgi:putative transposase